MQQRVLHSSAEAPFVFTATDASKDFLLREGTDMKYGARHLKRAIERLLVHPLSNLIATDQVMSGDWIRVDFDGETAGCLHKRSGRIGSSGDGEFACRHDRNAASCGGGSGFPGTHKDSAGQDLEEIVTTFFTA